MSMITVKLHQYTYQVCPENGVVMANERSGDWLVNDLATKLRVYAAWSRQQGTVGKMFNGHSYVKVFGHVINQKTGKEVTDGNIVGMFN